MDTSTLKQEEFKSSIYIKAKRFSYIKGGKKHTWDFIESLDSVSILLYHREKRAFILVRQFRIPLWDYQVRNNVKLDEKELGYSVELCSGLVDKNLSLEDIAKEECIEELGYKPKNLEKIGDFYSGFGSGASKQNFFFAVVDESDKIGLGGGVDDEEIETIFIKVDEFESAIKKVIHAAGLEFAYLWFMKHKAKEFGIEI